MPWYMGHLPGVNEIYAGIIRPSAESSTAENPSAGVWDSMGGGGDEHGHDHAHHTTAPTASPSASPSGSPTPDPCDGVPPCSMVCNTRYRECLAAPADCTELYAAHPTRPSAGWRGGCITRAQWSEGRATAQPCCRVVTCGAEYGGGGGGERRFLVYIGLCGVIPSSIGTLSKLVDLCVRSAPPPHLAMWGQLLSPEGNSLGG